MKRSYDVVMVVLNGVRTDNRVLRTAESVASAGFSVLLLGRHAKPVEEVSFDSFDLRLLPIERIPGFPMDSPSRTAALDINIRQFCLDVVTIVNTVRPSIVHTHDMFGIPVGALAKDHFASLGRPVRWIHDVHEWAEGCTTIPPRTQALAVQYERSYIRQADALTTVAPQISQILADTYELPDVPGVVFNAPRLRDFKPDLRPTVREVLGLGPRVPLMAYCGNVKEERGVHDIARVLEHVPELHAVIVTNNKDAYVDRLREIAAAAGAEGRLHLLPYVAGEDVSSFLRDADLGIHTMLPHPNGDVALPNKLFEYVHAGLPVVVSNCRAMVEFVAEHGIGRHYISADMSSLREAIAAVLADRASMARRSEQLRRQISWERQEEKIVDMYARVLGVETISSGVPARIPKPSAAGRAPEDGPPLRILHAPGGSAGQPWAIATALREKGHYSHNILTSVHRFGYRGSMYAPVDAMSVEQKLEFIVDLAQHFDVFHFYARPFLWSPPQHPLPSLFDLALLRLLGKVVVFHYQGTEARVASTFAEVNPFHYSDEDPYKFGESFPPEAQRMMLDFIRATCNAVFVTDAELGTFVPDAETVPRAIDLGEFTPVGPVNRERPLIVHAPSRPEIKGTPYVLAAVEQLRSEGLDFDFQLVEGLAHDEARQIYERADIVVDQLRIGWYGVLAVEAMALAKPVVVYVRPDLIDEFGGEPPFASADPTTVTDVLRELILDPDRREAIGRRARAFCEATHDSRVVASQLSARYRELLAEPAGHGDGEGLVRYLMHQLGLGDETAQVMKHTRTELGRSGRVLTQVRTELQERIAPARSLIDAGRSEWGEADERYTNLFEMVASISRSIKRLDAVRTWVEPLPAAPPPEARAPVPPPAGAGAKPASTSGGARANGGPDISLGEGISGDPFGIAAPLRRALGEDPPVWDSFTGHLTDDRYTHLADALLTLGSAIQRGDGNEDLGTRRLAFAQRLAAVLESGFVPVGESLVAVGPPGDATGKESRPVIHTMRQLELARAFRLIPPTTAGTQDALMRAVLMPVADGGVRDSVEGLTVFRPRSDDAAWESRLDELCRFFINGYWPVRSLGKTEQDLWTAALQDFAAMLPLYSVPEFHVVRASLSATLPLRVEITADGRTPRNVTVVGKDTDVALSLKAVEAEGETLRFEGTATTNLLRHTGRPNLALRVRGAQNARITVLLPALGSQAGGTDASVTGWAARMRETLAQVDQTVAVPLDPRLLARAGDFAPVAAGNGSVGHARRVEWLGTLHRLYRLDAFARQAQEWSASGWDSPAAAGPVAPEGVEPPEPAREKGRRRGFDASPRQGR